jgi:RNA polymerase sigma factor (sigma-70 family)
MPNRRIQSPSLRSIEERNKLILENKALPYHIVKKLSGLEMIKAYGEEDAAQVGFLGLIRAAEVWDENREAKFLTYAYYAVWNRVVNDIGRWFNRQKRAAKRRRAMVKLPKYDWMVNDRGEAEPGIFDPDVGDKLDSEKIISVCEWMCQTNSVLRIHGIVIKQRFFDGCSFDEMGEKRGISGQAMRKRVDNALKALRKRVMKCNSSLTLRS